MSKTIRFGNESLTVNQDDLTLEEAQELASEVFAGIADAEGHVAENGDFVFTKRAGRKG